MRIGLVGAGAIVQHAYLPALRNMSDIVLTSVVDTNVEIIAQLSKKYNLHYLGSDIAQSLNYVDIVIVATPNFSHAPVAVKCMESGKHVLCEKPISSSYKSACEMLDCAERNNVKLGVAHVRRFYPSSRAIWEIINDRQLGEVVSFNCQEGVVFNWSTVSDFLFDKEKSGGGVLMDIGIHLLDLLMWWFDSEPELLQYEDDSLGGVEAFSKLRLTFEKCENRIEGSVQISRLSQLKNNYRIECEKGIIEYDPFDMRRFYISENDSVSQSQMKIYRSTRKEFSFIDAVKAMLNDFCAAVRENSDPLVTGQEGMRVIRFIQKCYENRQQIETPWI